MEFIKMHGIGNDYVYIDCFRQPAPADPAALSVRVAKPHTGIGSDGLILILPCEDADARMRIFNADGSEAGMCGNGIRCVAKYLFDSGLCRKTDMVIRAKDGLRRVRVCTEGGAVSGASVDMGVPRFGPADVPVLADTNRVTLRACGREFDLFTLSVGNPHAVLFGALPSDEELRLYGPLLENDPAFPDRANIEWNEVLSAHRLRMRVWERGSGVTMACGTGATASAVAAIRLGLCESPVTVEMPYGELVIEYTGSGSAVMTGPAVTVFTGEFPDTYLL